jgi:adenylosuccinate synthase
LPASSATAWCCPRGTVPEIGELEEAGVNVRDRLRISEATTLILPYHVAIDQAREARGRGQDRHDRPRYRPGLRRQGGRRALRVQDLFDPKTFADRLRENLDFHNFVLTQYLGGEAVDFQATLDTMLATPIV